MHEPELGCRSFGLNSVLPPLLQTAFPFIPFMTKDAEKLRAVTYLPHECCINGHLLMQYSIHNHVGVAIRGYSSNQARRKVKRGKCLHNAKYKKSSMFVIITSIKFLLSFVSLTHSITVSRYIDLQNALTGRPTYSVSSFLCCNTRMKYNYFSSLPGKIVSLSYFCP